jgi:uncharacterized RDD family membrane protein YckC
LTPAHAHSAHRPLLVRRITARALDLLLGLVVAGIALGWTAAQLVPGIASFLARPGGELIFGTLVLPVALVLETLWCLAVGTTPGKAVMGLRIRRRDGAIASSREILGRQAKLYVHGLAAGLPVLSMLAAGVQLLRLCRAGETRWDADTGLQVQAMPLPRHLGASMSIALATGASFALLAAVAGAQLLLGSADRGYRSLAAVTAFAAPSAAGAVARAYDRGSWFNAWSGTTVRLAPGWQRLPAPPGDPGMAAWGIFKATEGCPCKLMVFKADAGGEPFVVPPGSSVAQLLAASWLESQAGTFSLGPLQRLDPAPGRRGWSAQGVRVGQTGERVDVAFLEHHDGVWILITTWHGDMLQAMSHVDVMRQALVGSFL